MKSIKKSMFLSRLIQLILVVSMVFFIIICSKGKSNPQPSIHTNATTGASIKVEQYIPYHDSLKAIGSHLLPGHHQVISNAILRVEPAVVSLGYVETGFMRTRFKALGSGIFIDPRGYILTTYQILKGKSRIKVTFFDMDHRHQFDGVVVAIDPAINFALIKIKSVNGHVFPYVPMGNFTTVMDQDLVLAVGSPDGLTLKVIPGRIQSTKQCKVIGGRTFHNLIQSDIKVTGGLRGCSTFDIQGEIVGLYIGDGVILSVNQSSPILDINTMILATQ
jgi:S1-C subfamily serine protease